MMHIIRLGMFLIINISLGLVQCATLASGPSEGAVDTRPTNRNTLHQPVGRRCQIRYFPSGRFSTDFLSDG